MYNLSDCSVLAVDDTKFNLDILVGLLGNQYNFSVALNGESALRQIEQNPPDLILLDIMMPGMDGTTVLRHIRDNESTKDIPVLMLTALSDSVNKARCFDLGAVDYVQKPFDIHELKARIRTHLSLAIARKQLKEHNQNLEAKVEEQTREVFATQQATIESMAAMAEYRDSETGGHINRVKGYVEVLATELVRLEAFKEQISPSMIPLLVRSAPLHDIGKVGIPDDILLKPGKLTTEEFEKMKSHTVYGAKILSSVQKKVGNLPFLDIAKEIAYYHHEKWDGKGYPAGLAGEAIPLSARIMAIADVYDALISRRIYKPPFPHSKAIQIIQEESGKSFEPAIVDTFLAPHCIEQIRQVALAFNESQEEEDALSQ